MNNFNVLTILILTFFYTVRLRGDKINDVNQLKLIFEQFKQDPDFLSRKVFVGDQNISILDFVNSSDSNKSFNVSAITEENVYELSHVTNIVLSCEYSEITYHLIKIIDKIFSLSITDIRNNSNGKLNTINQNFTIYYFKLYYILKYTKSMILTLARLVKFTRNVVYKYHDILRVLLSWYAFIEVIDRSRKDKEVAPPDLEKRLENIIMTNFQMKNRLDRFLANHCYRLEDLETYKEKVDKSLEEKERDELIKMQGDKLDLISLYNSEEINDKFVIETSDNPMTRSLTDLIIDQVPDKTLIITIPTTEIKERRINKLFKYDMIYDFNITNIILCEKILIAVLCEIIVLHEIKELQSIMVYSKDTSKRSLKCDNLVNEIKNYTNKINNDELYEQPISFIKYLVKNIKTISNLCLLMLDKNNDTIINTLITTLKNHLNHVKEINETAELGTFLTSLSQKTIYAKLHPMILNTFWEQSIISYSPSIEYFGVEYQYLHMNYNNPTDNNLCKKTSVTLVTLQDIEIRLKKCIEDKDKKSCYSEIHEKYNEAIIVIANITLNTFPKFSTDWKKMLFTLIQNKEMIEFRDTDIEKFFNDTRIQRLRTFIYSFKTEFLENQYVKCSCGVSSTPDKIGKCSKSSDRNWNEKIKEVQEIKNKQELEDIIKYQQYFKTIIVSLQRLSVKVNPKIEFKVYWDGTKKNLNEILNIYTVNTFEIQDPHDYVNYFIKWVIMIPHSMLMQLLNDGINDRINGMNNENMTELTKSIKNILKINLLKHSLVYYYLPDFIKAFKLLVNGKKKQAKTIQNELYDEFNFINAVYTPNNNGDIVNYSNWINEFSSEIQKLMVILNYKED